MQEGKDKEPTSCVLAISATVSLYTILTSFGSLHCEIINAVMVTQQMWEWDEGIESSEVTQPVTGRSGFIPGLTDFKVLSFPVLVTTEESWATKAENLIETEKTWSGAILYNRSCHVE